MAGRQQITRIAFLLLRLLTGGLFVFAGGIKARDPQGFLTAIESFRLLPYHAAWLLTFFLPWLEIWAGFAVIFRQKSLGALSMLFTLMIVFVAVLSISWARGLEIDCGCFGNLFPENSSYPQLLLRDALILVGIAVLLFRQRINASTCD